MNDRQHPLRFRNRTLAGVALLAAFTFAGPATAETNKTAAGKPAEAGLEPFPGEPRFEVQPVFKGGRFPSVVVALDGTVLAFWGQNTLPRLRRSEDGGRTWTGLSVSRVLYDGGGYGRGYGLVAGLVRLPVQGQDILLFSTRSRSESGPSTKPKRRPTQSRPVAGSHGFAPTWPTA